MRLNLKGKKHKTAGQRPPAVGALALLLSVLALTTMPLALSKYSAVGAGKAGTRIAKWAPSMDGVAAAWDKTVLLRSRAPGNVPEQESVYFWGGASDQYWISVNDANHMDTGRTDGRQAVLLKPNNSGSEVSATYTYSFRMDDDSPVLVNGNWLHVDINVGADTGAHAANYSTNNTSHPLHGYSHTLGPGAVTTTATPVRVYVFLNKDDKPAGLPLSSYAKIKFVATATQVD